MKIFILEDDRLRINQFWQAGIGHDLTVALSYGQAVDKFAPPYDLLCLDHDLGGEQMVSPNCDNTGSSFCRWLVKNADPVETIVHSYNAYGAERMVSMLRNAGWPAVLAIPFGPAVLRTLNNLPKG